MKRILLGAIVLVGLLAPAGASAYVEHPAIGEAAAFERTQSYLAKTYPGWRTRKYGYIDCRHGRINGYIWSCAVGWIRGYNCWQGRTRIENEYAEEGVVYYSIRINARRC
ncbi:MAG TPA: hypothetical protein VFU16_10105 [Solirubrobacterales bacterium]|nr:hypothetical protein [Solirubrobacterales bacterium]